jgi:uncharacterized membrane-anchored protein YjiN (DUF445 family)
MAAGYRGCRRFSVLLHVFPAVESLSVRHVRSGRGGRTSGVHPPTSASSAADAVRRSELRRMKGLALGLLLVAAAVFVASTVAGADGWLGYVQATAEAAMVGALADWFAVTALFRHPLGIPIPHTAIIPTRKDQIGASLGDFVETNFLADEVVRSKLRGAQVSRRLADWLGDPAHQQTVAQQASAAIRGVLDVLRDDEVQSSIERAVVSRVRAAPLAPFAGRVLDVVTAGGRHQRVLDALLDEIAGSLQTQRSSLRASFERQSPWWVPEPIDDRIFEKVFDGVIAFLGELRSDPAHDLRRHLDQRLTTFVEELRMSPEMLARGEELKEELLAHPAVREWLGGMWTEIKARIADASDDPSSELRSRLARGAAEMGERLGTDPSLAAKVDRWVESTVGYVVAEYRHEASALIRDTVAAWDPVDTAQRIELQVGRDLQFIRINGTIVGGLAGLVIHAVAQAL